MNILIADPNPEVQSALHLISSRIPQVTGVSEVENMVQLLAVCTHTCPDLILLDLELVRPSRSRAHALADLILVLRRLCPCSQVAVLSSRMESRDDILAAGADGFISKMDSPDVVLSEIVRFLETRS